MNSVSKKHSPLKSSSSSSSTSKNDSHKSKNDSHKSKNESHKSKNIKSNITFSTNSINSSSTPLTPIPDQNTTYYPGVSAETVKEAENYLVPRSNEEEMPIQIEIQDNVKYYNLEVIFNSFYPENSLSIAKDKSKEEREKKGIKDNSFVYGEITFRSIAFIYEYLKKEYGKLISNGTFYDLGSGTGKGVLAFSLLKPFTKCIGIEFLESLFNLSNEMNAYYQRHIEDIFYSNQNLFDGFFKPNTMKFFNGDFLKEEWNDAALILANSTCFSQELMTKIAIKANNECKKGCIIITFTKRLTALNSEWEFKKGFKRLMTWGIATVFIYRRNV